MPRLGVLGALVGVLALSGCATTHAMGTPVDGARCPQDGGRSDVTWVRPEDGGEQVKLAGWCDVVGSPVLVPGPDEPDAPSTVPEAGASHVTVATWNIWVGGGDLDLFLSEELGWSCAAGAPSHGPGGSHQPFVVLIQEAFRRGGDIPTVERGSPVSWPIHPDLPGHRGPDIGAVAAECGLYLAYFPSSRNGFDEHDGQGEDKGNAILSSLPLRDIAAVELPFEAGRKVGVAAWMDVPVGPGRTEPLGVATVHLDVAATLVRTLVTGNQTRVRQLRGFLEALDGVGFSEGPLAVGGDFNTWAAKDGSLKVMSEEFPESPGVTPEGTRGPFPPDHVFFRGDDGPFELDPDSYEVIRTLYGSDHNPRLLRLTVRDPSD
jgi:endonuclease/exonuclease/phosphatase family metal-dependent hydrolase